MAKQQQDSAENPPHRNSPGDPGQDNAETQRLKQAADREANWQRWGTYLPERQWGTVREDYSATGDVWSSFTHDMARYRAYRWGEDGLLGWTDRECRLCFSTSLWNGNDPILKERLFGLTGKEGNHGEDVKELYYYLDATPTGSYAKALYKYPQAAFPYNDLIGENRRRDFNDSEYELLDTGVFADNRYFDVAVEYAKSGVEDTLIRITVSNRGPDAADLTVLPTLTLRNNWSWRNLEPGEETRPWMHLREGDERTVIANHRTLGRYRYSAIEDADAPSARFPLQPAAQEILFTENDTNKHRLDAGDASATGFTKDAFDRYIVGGDRDAVNPAQVGTKTAFCYRLHLEPGASAVLRLRLVREGGDEDAEDSAEPLTLDPAAFDRCFALRMREADAFYAARIPAGYNDDERNVARQAYAGLLWTRQFYYYVSERWFEGDPAQPKPPGERLTGRNASWRHLFCRDVLSMPDKWEYPWFAAWDTAFHVIPFATIDPEYAKAQLLLLLREWYLHPNGQMPAYEFNFSDVNPPVHAWAAIHVYQIAAQAENSTPDVDFLERCFQKLLLNFTWWVNHNDGSGHNLFGGGFLGLDNVGVFNRSTELPPGTYLNQSDGTAWMGLFCASMLQIAVELAQTRPAYEDIASKFFEHYISIIDAINELGGTGLWDEDEGFFFDQLASSNEPARILKVRSIVGIVPLYAIGILLDKDLDRLPGFRRRMDWFLKNKPHLAQYVRHSEPSSETAGSRFLALVPKDRLVRILRCVLDESEFLSEHGIRSLSQYHREHPFQIQLDGRDFDVHYVPAEGDNALFGGNSNWRGPVWFPVNFLLINALERYHAVYGDTLKVECPVGSGHMLNLREVAEELERRLAMLVLRDPEGRRPCHGCERRYIDDPHWRDLVLFSEFFCGDTGRGLGASHQTGWSALVSTCLANMHGSRTGDL